MPQHLVVYVTDAPRHSLLVRLEDVACVTVPSVVHVPPVLVRPTVIHLPITIPRRPVAITPTVVAASAVAVALVAVALVAVAELAPVAAVVTSVADADASMRVEPDKT